MPEKYENVKIKLTSLGIEGFAFERTDVIRFLTDEGTANFAVLGGEVLLRTDDNKLAYTYDNWSAPERPRTESFEVFCKRTREKALDYINRYPRVRPGVFVIDITSEITAGWWS